MPSSSSNAALQPSKQRQRRMRIVLVVGGIAAVAALAIGIIAAVVSKTASPTLAKGKSGREEHTKEL